MDIPIETILGRAEALPSLPGLAPRLDGARVMITGAGGSVGSALVRFLMDGESLPSKLILVDNSETNIYGIMEWVRERASPIHNVQPVLVSIDDTVELARVFRRHYPDVVIHAAALKHVGLIEENIRAAIRTNIIGTDNVLKCAKAYDAFTVVVSTDKAVEPQNVYGATKRVAEVITTEYAPNASIARLVNVLGSSGSVYPKFARLIREGLPVTVNGAKRHFMTEREAAATILAALFEPSTVVGPGTMTTLAIRTLAERMGATDIRMANLPSWEKATESLWWEKERPFLADHGIYTTPTGAQGYHQEERNAVHWQALLEEAGAMSLRVALGIE